MTFSLEYHNVVECPPRRSIPASLALFWMLLVPLAPNSLAQINSASATSSSSGHAATAAPASVTSIGHGGYAPSSSGPSTLANLPHSPGGAHINNNENHPHRTANGTAYYPYIYAVPWPYAVDLGNAEGKVAAPRGRREVDVRRRRQPRLELLQEETSPARPLGPGF